MLILKLIQYYVKLILFVKANICFYNTKCIKNLPVISLVRVKDVKETKFIVTSAEYETKKLFSFHLKRKWIKRNKKKERDEKSFYIELDSTKNIQNMIVLKKSIV